MAGLYKKVLQGAYPKIPNHFSEDLVKTLSDLMKVDAVSRPSCEQILELPQVQKMTERLFGLDSYRDDIEDTQM